MEKELIEKMIKADEKDNIYDLTLNKANLRQIIEWSIPIAIKPTKPAKTMFIPPFTSANAQQVVVDTLVEQLSKYLED